MRRAVLLALLLALVLPAPGPAAAGEPLDGLLEPLVPERGESEPPSSAFALLDDLEAELPPAAAARARDLLAPILGRPVTVQVVALSFSHLPGALAPLADREDPVLTGPDRAAIRAGVADGSLTVVGTVAASGAPGEALRAASGVLSTVAARFESDGRIASAECHAIPAGLRTGLSFAGRAMPCAGGRAALFYDVALAGPASVETRVTLAGRLDRVRMARFRVRGRVRLAPGEPAAAVELEPDGTGRLLLLSLSGPGLGLRAVTDLGDGCIALAAGHLERDPTPELPGFCGSGSFSFIPPDEAEAPDLFPSLALAAGVAESRLVPTLGGFRIGVADVPQRTILAGLVETGSERDARRFSLSVRRSDGARVRLPLSPGSGFGFFSGSVETARTGTGWEAGCDNCVVTWPENGVAAEGIWGAGRVREDGTADLAIAGRTVVDRREIPARVRRTLPGWRFFTFDAFTLPLVSDRIFRFRGAMPNAGGRIADVARVGWRIAAPAGSTPRIEAPAAPPVPLVVNGYPLSVRPGGSGELLLEDRTPFTRRYENGGWCGMRVRFPVASTTGLMPPPDLAGPSGPFLDPEEVSEGLRVRVRAHELRGDEIPVEVEAEIRGKPESLGTFDPRDGPVDLVRIPRLLVVARDLPLRGGGVVAGGAGLVLTVTRTGAAPGFGPCPRLRIEAPGRDPVLLRTGSGGRILAGGVSLLPLDLEAYESNHENGQTTTGPGVLTDGADLSVEGAGAAVFLRLQRWERARLAPREVTSDEVPKRAEIFHRILGIARHRFRRGFAAPFGATFTFHSPEGVARPFRLTAEIPARGDGK